MPSTAPPSTSGSSPDSASALSTTLKLLTSSHFLSGGLSGLSSAIILQPADLLKTRLQQAPPSTTATATLLNTIRTLSSGPSPIRALWRGTLPSALRTGIGSALYFSSLHAVRRSLAKATSKPANPPGSINGRISSLPQLPSELNLIAGSATRAIVGFIMMPITIIKVRYESSMYNYTSLSAASRDIFRSEGMKGFFSGWGATAIRDAPYAGLYVVFYEKFKVGLGRIVEGRERKAGGQKNGDGGERGKIGWQSAAVVNTASGGLAGAVATAITNPFDALKTRIQVDPGRYRNMWHAAKVVWGETDGGRWRGRSLFDGLGLRIARKAVSSAVVWGLYEGLVR